MIRPLTRADTLEALQLLRARPLHNTFLEYVVAAGALGRVPGILGYLEDGRLQGILLIGPQGGTVLEVGSPRAHAPLADAALTQPVRPRHLVGEEALTAAFFGAYGPHVAPPQWSRREPVYLLSAADLAAAGVDADADALERANEGDLDTVVAWSALQHVEDLKDDRCAGDPAGFRERHRKDLRDGRWWVLRERGRIQFQVHVGAESRDAVQIGGVLTAPDARNRGLATRGVAGIAARLLRRKPSVTLFCDEANAAARTVYERVGFHVVYHNRSWLLDEPLVPEVGRYA